ncbi:MAG: HlyD family secretion protein [Vicinamibacterales bacterium]
MSPGTDLEVSTNPRPRGRHAFIALGIVALVVSGGIGSYAFFTAGRESTDDAVVDADVVSVTARVGGLVATLGVHDNQVVKKGDLLLTLDTADFLARLAQARAELQTATAQAAGAHAQERVVQATARGSLRGAQAQVSASASAVHSADAQIAAAEAGLARAQAEAVKAERDLTRANELVATDAIARQRLDAAQLAHDSAEAALAQARASVTAAQAAKHTAESRVAEAEARVSQTAPVDEQIAAGHAAALLADARVASANAAVHLAELQLSYTQVIAPDDGLVTQLTAREGSLVQMGQPLAQLVPHETYLIANFKETQIDGMRPGDRADVDIDAYPGRTFEAVIESLAGGTGSRFSLIPPDNASGNFVKVVQRVPVRLAWKTPPEVPLKAGLSANVSVYLSGNAR